MLTIFVEHEKRKESISRPIPITQKEISVQFFPEGGTLIDGISNRVYVRAQNQYRKPTDITAQLMDDLGNRITTFRTLRDGLGRFSFTPQPDRSHQRQQSRTEQKWDSHLLSWFEYQVEPCPWEDSYADLD